MKKFILKKEDVLKSISCQIDLEDQTKTLGQHFCGGWWIYKLVGKLTLGDIVIVRFGRPFLIVRCGVFGGCNAKIFEGRVRAVNTRFEIAFYEDFVQVVISLGEVSQTLFLIGNKSFIDKKSTMFM